MIYSNGFSICSFLLIFLKSQALTVKRCAEMTMTIS